MWLKEAQLNAGSAETNAFPKAKAAFGNKGNTFSSNSNFRGFSTDNRQKGETGLIGEVRSVTFNNDEDSIYRGPPLIDPKYSYECNPGYRKTDPALPIYKRAPLKLGYIGLDLVDFIEDILNNRQE